MSERESIKDILVRYQVELNIVHDGTTIDDVGKQLGPLAQLMSTVDLTPFMGVVRDFWARKGLASKTDRSTIYHIPYAKVVACLALSINRNKLDLQQKMDIDSGAYFEVALPASVLSGEGVLKIFVVEVQQEEITLTLNIVIPGQMQAWGKGTTVIENLLSAIDDYIKIVKS